MVFHPVLMLMKSVAIPIRTSQSNGIKLKKY